MKIADQQERQRELVAYARSLNISTGKFKNEQGQINEEKLAILLYDHEQGQKSSRNQNIGFLFVGIFLALITFVLFFLFWKSIVHL